MIHQELKLTPHTLHLPRGLHGSASPTTQQRACRGRTWGASLGDVICGDLCQVAHAFGGKVAQALQLPHLLLLLHFAASCCPACTHLHLGILRLRILIPHGAKGSIGLQSYSILF